jgi:hypothetical protein
MAINRLAAFSESIATVRPMAEDDGDGDVEYRETDNSSVQVRETMSGEKATNGEAVDMRRKLSVLSVRVSETCLESLVHRIVFILCSTANVRESRLESRVGGKEKGTSFEIGPPSSESTATISGLHCGRVIPSP